MFAIAILLPVTATNTGADHYYFGSPLSATAGLTVDTAFISLLPLFYYFSR